MLADDLALEYPYLDADHAVRGLCFGSAVIDLGPQRMQRYASFAIPLRACDLYAVQAAGAHDLDALRAQSHRVRDRALHCAAEHDPLLELLRDRIRDQLRVELGPANLFDVDVYRHAEHFLQLTAKRLDVLAFLANHDTWTRAVDRDLRVLGRTLDHDPADRRVRELLLEEIANLDVLLQHARKILGVGIPFRRPVAQHRQPE